MAATENKQPITMLGVGADVRTVKADDIVLYDGTGLYL